MPRGFDHLVLACRDLDAAADLYRRMGFTVGAQNRHSWGTLNRIVQLNGVFLELVTTEPGFAKPAPGDPVHPFAGFIYDFLARRQGLAMLALASTDSAADARRLAATGIGCGAPFFFERSGARADGQPTHVAFTLAFASTADTGDASLFFCQHHFPDAFWSEALQLHANGAQSVVAVTLAAPAALPMATVLSSIMDCASPMSDGRTTLDTGRGCIELATDTAVDTPPRFTGYRVTCADIAVTRAALEAGRVAFAQHGSKIVVSPTVGLGATITFAAA